MYWFDSFVREVLVVSAGVMAKASAAFNCLTDLSVEMVLHCASYAVQRTGGAGRVGLRLERSNDGILILTLADEADPSFLSTLKLSRDDYLNLKKQQGLLVDFDDFPAQLVRLLQQCDCGNLFLSMHKEGPSTMYLEIIERNDFKRLIHLSLKTCIASDSEIKQHMAENIEILRNNNRQLDAALKSKEAAFMDKEKFLEMRINDLSSCLSRFNEERVQKENEYLDILRREQDKIEQEKIDWKKYHEVNFKSQLSSMQEVISKKDKQLDDVNIRVEQLQDTIKSLESQVKDKGKRIYSLEKQLHSAKMEGETWRNRNGALDRDFHDREQNLVQTKSRMLDLEKALKEKSDMLKDTLDSLQSLQREKFALEEKVNNNEIMHTKKNMEYQVLNEQLSKANEIIAKQYTVDQELREKLKTRGNIALEQEKVIKTQEAKIKSLEKTAEDLKIDLEDSKKAYESLRSEYEGIKRTNDERGEIVKSNNAAIQWLHKKIDALESAGNMAAMTGRTVMSVPTLMPYTDLDENRLSNLYLSGDLVSTKSSKSKTSNLIDEQYSVDPIYLKPTSNSSAKTSSRSKSLDRRPYKELPVILKDAGSSNGTQRSNLRNNKKYITSKMSSYFPRP